MDDYGKIVESLKERGLLTDDEQMNPFAEANNPILRPSKATLAGAMEKGLPLLSAPGITLPTLIQQMREQEQSRDGR